MADQDAAQQQDAAYDEEQHQREIEVILAEYQRRQMLEHLTGPFVSLIVHIIMLVSCFLLMTGRTTQEISDVEVSIEEMEVKELDPKIIQELQKLENVPQDVVPDVERPDVPQEQVQAVTEDFSNEMAQTDDAMDFSDVLDIKASDTPLKISGLYGGRSSEGRKKAIARFGGSSVTESAVLKGLRWLKEHQNPDGSWSQSQKDAMCGFALLTYLAHGETPMSPEFGPTVQKAMQFLTNAMMATTDPRGLGGGGYVNGIATYALCEGYGMTKIPFLKPAAEKGLEAVLKGQQPCGGFDYSYAKTKRWDTSVVGWQVQAMKAGYVAGCENAGIPTGIENASRFLRNVAYANGKFGYSSPGAGSWGVHSAGTLCLMLIGEAGSPEAKTGATNLDEGYTAKWDEKTGPTDLYCWYYATQVMFHAGQTTWKKWNKVFSPMVVTNQKSDGHWECGMGMGKDAKAAEYDPYYITCLCCLSLQVYYRYLPTYKMPEAVAKGASALDAKDQDLGLEIE
ncbi:MAG: hypothetical protein A3K19_28090 [Lentisphaerae bacterium RIFOXYB12_FULL_65_16]|nr:MAG: hypothetical protein A3K19_28090 [Lentisphaerae bacterium RIFOXYB12_FULL_65_16]